MTTALPATTDQNLNTTLARVATEIGRTDSKASLLLAFDGAALAGIAGLADKPLPLATKVIGGLAALTLAAAAVLLLLVVRPRLGGTTPAPGSFPHLAQLSETEIPDVMAQDYRAANLRVLSALTVRKFTALASAVDLILAALGLLVLAAAAAPASTVLASL
ncbi:Pycsar system effector family protein [Streptomyces sp. NPDC101393]|uniref:Pycsar system effector family protein n=1 Tax=Streptomyces sp. NPDC101393 TaxID=3366141 RepID=UPI00382377D6